MKLKDKILSPLTTPKTFIETIEYRVVRTKEELEKAFHLVYQEYLKRGYTQLLPSQQKLSIFNSLPETTTFIAIWKKEVLATATLIPDSPLGLPMDEIYHQELENFRKRKGKLCEISMLASNTELFKNGVSLMLHSKKMFFIFSLFKLIFDYVYNILHLDYICITINPKHKLTYDFLLFKDLGELKTYSSVNNAPAIGKFLDLNNVKEECKKTGKEGLYRMFFSSKNEPTKFSPKLILSAEDLRYFFVEKTDIFKKATPFQLEYIKKCYPTYDFSQILKGI
ncbi:MAG: hypothetical protein DRQ06_02920 [Candidatus Hydrothermota bacterium]|nr:MAG: hypothetical protein DRQ06_02920 [Candidatus Hydrothermae bacterium]